MPSVYDALVAFLLLGVAVGATSEGQCLPALQRSPLQSMLFSAREYNFRQAHGGIRIAQDASGTWDSHLILTEILRILVEDYLGHSVLHAPITTTSGAYQKLSRGELDINVEMWSSVAPREYECFIVQQRTAMDGGPLAFGENARSGLYLRPAQHELEPLLQSGRFYAALESTILPTLPSCVTAASRPPISPADRSSPSPSLPLFAAPLSRLLSWPLSP